MSPLAVVDRPRPSLARGGRRRLLSIAAGFALVAHGLIHLIGVALLWRPVQLAGLTDAQVHPTPGSLAGIAVGIGWLCAAALFVIVGIAVLAGRGLWRQPATVAALLSAAVIAPLLSVAGSGLVVDALVLLAVAATSDPGGSGRRLNSTRPASRPGTGAAG